MGKFFWVIGVVCALSVFGNAQITMTPREGSLSLVPKSVDIQAQVRGGVCESTATYWFSNSGEKDNQYEVDFTCKVAPGQVITGFAYWFKDEKVPAFVVEKKRASQIYQTIVSSQRDPALIERIDRSTFRVRIFPVMGSEDLRVEVKTSQAQVGGQFHWTIPADVRQPLEKVSLAIDGLEIAPGRRWDNNWKIPQNGAQIRFEKANFVPQAEFRLTLSQDDAPIRVRSFGAISGGKSGYFAAVAWPGGRTTLGRPTVVGASSARVRKLGNSWIVVGRYVPGKRPALRVNGRTFTIELDSNPQPNHAALKLWADEEIEALSDSKSSRDKVVALSLRHGLPSPHTSLLAIPKAEREAFARVIAEEEIKSLVAQAARLSHKNGYRSQLQAINTKMTTIQDRYGITKNDVRSIAWNLADAYARHYAVRLSTGQKLSELFPIKQDYQHLVKRYGLKHYDSFDAQVKQELGWYVAEVTGAWINGEVSTREYERTLSRIRQHIKITPNYLFDYRNEISVIEAYETVARSDFFGDVPASELQHAKGKLSRAESRFAKDCQPLRAQGRNNAVSKAISRWKREYYQGIPGLSASESLLQKTKDQGQALRNSLKHPVARRLVLDSLFHSPLFSAAANEDFETVLSETYNAENYSNLTVVIAVINLGFGISEAKRAYEVNLIDVYDSLYYAYGQTELPREAIKETEMHLDLVTKRLGLKDWKVYRKTSIFENDYDGSWSYYRNQYYYGDRFKVWNSISKGPYYSYYGRRYGRENEPYRTRYIQAVRDGKSPQEIEKARADFERSMLGSNYDEEMYGTPSYRKTWSDLRIQILYTEVVIDELKQKPSTSENETKLAELRKRREELRAKFGDPLIQVTAPRHAQTVYAVFPDGEIKLCTWNPSTGFWEVRFDIPSYFKEGQYDVKVVVVMPDRRRESQTFSYTADTTSPKGSVSWTILGDQHKLTLKADPDTARAEVFFADGTRVSMRKVSEGVFVWEGPTSMASQLTHVAVTDRAHNRTMLNVEAP